MDGLSGEARISGPGWEGRMRVHLIGICGTAMSAVACMLKDSGAEVQGSDTAAYPPIGPMLKEKGIRILDGYRPENLAWGPETVVVGNVAGRDNPEVLEAQRRGLTLLSMPQVIRQQFLEGRKSIVITGTHGKTTVTSMMAHILAHAGLDPSFLVGGIPLDFGSNYRLGEGPHFVIEGDEYDTAFFDKKAKFFHYNPSCVVMNALEFDHADIYRDLGHLEETFKELAQMVPPEGQLAWCVQYDVLDKVAAQSRCQVVPFALVDTSRAGPPRAATGQRLPWGTYREQHSGLAHVINRMLTAGDISADSAGTTFTVADTGTLLARVTIKMWGQHNVLNALAAFSAALWAGVVPSKIAEALASFQGVRRRFQVIRQEGGITVVDDFAHHPTAVRETLKAARSRFPNSRIFAAFHFESNTSRRKVFEKDFSKAFNGADYVFLTYPLKKKDDLKPEEYLDPKAVMNGIRRYAAGVFAFEEMRAMAAHMAGLLGPGDVVIAMSGRDFTPFYDALFEMLGHRS